MEFNAAQYADSRARSVKHIFGPAKKRWSQHTSESKDASLKASLWDTSYPHLEPGETEP